MNIIPVVNTLCRCKARHVTAAHPAWELYCLASADMLLLIAWVSVAHCEWPKRGGVEGCGRKMAPVFTCTSALQALFRPPVCRAPRGGGGAGQVRGERRAPAVCLPTRFHLKLDNPPAPETLRAAPNRLASRTRAQRHRRVGAAASSESASSTSARSSPPACSPGSRTASACACRPASRRMQGLCAPARLIAPAGVSPWVCRATEQQLAEVLQQLSAEM